MYQQVNQIPSHLKEQTFVPKVIPGTRKLEPVPEGMEGDYIRDEKGRTIELTDQGHIRVEKLLVDYGLLSKDDSLYAATNLNLLY